MGTHSSRLGYAGEWMGLADGTVYLRARHYQPALGRFLERDSFPGIPSSPQSLHKYTYTHNNPVNHTDPSGQFLFLLPLLFAAGMVIPEIALAVEVGLWVYDTMSTVQVLIDPCIPPEEKSRQIGLWLAGTFMPGGGYDAIRTPGKALSRHADDAVALSGKLLPDEHGYQVFANQPDGPPTSSGRRYTDETNPYLIERAPAPPGGDDLPPGINPNRFCSFTPETLVSTADGLMPIGDLAVGELVWAYDEATGATGLYTITAVLVHDDAVLVDLTIDGEPLTTTPEHPFFTQERGWVAAEDLWLGDHIRTAQGAWGTIERLLMRSQTRTMYNLTVATAHTFFVGSGRWLVHNDCGEIYKRLASKVTEAQNIRQKVFKSVNPDDRHLTVFYGEADNGQQIVVFSELYGTSGRQMDGPVRQMKSRLRQQGYLVFGGELVDSGSMQRHAEIILSEAQLPASITRVEGGVSQAMCDDCISKLQPVYDSGLQTFERNGIKFFLRDH